MYIDISIYVHVYIYTCVRFYASVGSTRCVSQIATVRIVALIYM